MAMSVEEIAAAIEKLTLLEANELRKTLQERFGVTAALPVAAAGAPAAVGADGGVAPAAAAEEEKTTFDVILTSAGDKKIQVIKAVREVTTLGLKEAKDLVESAPAPIKEGVSKEEAASLKAKIEEQGGTVEIR